MIARLSLILATLVLLVAPAPAHPPDASFADWYNALRQPDTGSGCCSLADCGPVETRVVGGAIEVYWTAGSQWLPVPMNKILLREHNPEGQPVACIGPAGTVYCFVDGPRA